MALRRLFITIRHSSNSPPWKKNDCHLPECDTSPMPDVEQKKEGCFSSYSKDTKPISHAIIDLDGVILDAIKYNISSHEDYLMKWKKYLKLKTRYEIMSMRNQDAGKIVTQEYMMPFNEKVYAHGVWQYQRERYHKARLIKGVDDFIYYLVQNRIPLALISSSNAKGFKILYDRLKKYGLDNCFCHYVHGDQVNEGKPSREMLCKAAKMFFGGPDDYSKYLVIDSGVCGAIAAKEAGMQSVLITDQCIPKDLVNIATLTLFSIKDLDPQDFSLPPIKKNIKRRN
ncbi:unnamed protein product [Nezara viridula]|uniref:Uncharacterized protein n=1 Tax=Nezara viridula TaxID=85310 RepID=A0A9P0HRW2_NEZVI|nr:unnamed protein product [Nezara viridula]